MDDLKEYNGMYVRIKNYENELLAAGIVNKTDVETIEIVPQEKRMLPTLLYGLPVKVCIHCKGNEELVLGGVVYLSNKDFLVIFDVKLLEEIEQRNYFRVTVGTSGVLSGIATPLHQEMRRLEEDDLKWVWIIDVSLTGLQFITDIWFELGKEYLIRFDLNGTELSLPIKIDRVVAVVDKPIEYGGLFFDMQDREEVQLCRCLYQIQMIERRRRINLVS